jgi:hypothetical protein
VTRNYTMAVPVELSPDEKLLRCLPSEAVRAMCAAPVAGWTIGTGDAVMEFVHAPNPGTPLNHLVSLGDTCTGPDEVPGIGEEISINGVTFLTVEVHTYPADGTADDGAGTYDYHEVTVQVS